ncbi:MAG: hypothetical protein IPJ30_15155 [Acidobacteria bacterium]|nr:hypothetical protein [Acidobacteriota bacterium]
MKFEKNHRTVLVIAFLYVLFVGGVAAQQVRTLSGAVITPQFEFVPNVTVKVETSDKTLTVVTDAEGTFSLQVPMESIAVTILGKNIEPQTRMFSASESLDSVQIRVTYIVPPINESVVIEADALTPEIENRNDTIYRNNLFGRDDQLIFSLNAGINAGQHEGGGKSLEIRRFDSISITEASTAASRFRRQRSAESGNARHGQGYLGARNRSRLNWCRMFRSSTGPFRRRTAIFGTRRRSDTPARILS